MKIYVRGINTHLRNGISLVKYSLQFKATLSRWQNLKKSSGSSIGSLCMDSAFGYSLGCPCLTFCECSTVQERWNINRDTIG